MIKFQSLNVSDGFCNVIFINFILIYFYFSLITQNSFLVTLLDHSRINEIFSYKVPFDIFSDSLVAQHTQTD